LGSTHSPIQGVSDSPPPSYIGRLRLKCDGTCAETKFGLSAKRTSPFKSAGASVQSTTGSRGVRIGGSNAGYTKFRGIVKRCEGNWLPTPFASFPFTSSPVPHRVPSHFNWTVHQQRREADCLAPTSAGSKNEYIHTFTPVCALMTYTLTYYCSFTSTRFDCKNSPYGVTGTWY